LTTPLSVAQGGTGALTVAGALSTLGAAARGTNGDITSLAALTTPLSVGQGGTGAANIAGALASLGAATRGANSDITSLDGLVTPLSVDQGGTGAANVAGALASLGAASRGANSDITSLAGLATPLSVAEGGTGSNSASAALGSLGGAARGANSDITSLAALSTPLSVAQGGTGSNSAGAALSALGGAARGANSDITSMTGLSGVNGTILSLLTSLPVYITSTGTLGVVGSSARFKHDVVDMGDSTRGLLRLRPVRFRYNQDIDPTGQEQYGLIAEEVARVYPDLVANDSKGRPLTVRYQALTPMLLNELQRQAREIADQRRQLDAQKDLLRLQAAQLDALTSRIENVEASLAKAAEPTTQVRSRSNPSSRDNQGASPEDL
jgi:hypothetical protein